MSTLGYKINLNEVKKLLDFFHLCEQLKIEKRHGKTSNGERDIVACHTWRMAIMGMFLAQPLLDEYAIDMLKVLKLILIHDLPEIITGDQAYFYHAFDEHAKDIKQQKENDAMQTICTMLPDVAKNELCSLWVEYEEQLTYESKLAKALDKIEAQIQHNEADISVWNECDKKNYNTYLDKFCTFSDVLMNLKLLVQNESKSKLHQD